MNTEPTDQQLAGYNRRDFIKGGSVATLMTMLGGVELFAQTNTAPPTDPGIAPPPKVKVAVIGLGSWGREILNTLAVARQADVAAICDHYPAFMKRASTAAPNAKQVEDYKAILADPEIKGVVIASPTHLHKEIAIAALKAGKHVYCEAPLAHTMEDARALAKAALAAPELVFQPGLQMRSDPQNHFVMPFIRSGAIGHPLLARSQWHKKYSWRASAANPDREKAMNWRLTQATSLGLIGELGCHPIDQSNWLLKSRPSAVTASGSILFWDDGRDVPDTVQARFEYPSHVCLNYDATLANSFDASYDMFYGSDAAVMMRDTDKGRKAWLFKEVDSPLLGWEIYARKDNFFEETGIALVAGASKSTQVTTVAPPPFTNTPLSFSLGNFLRNAYDVSNSVQMFHDTYGDDSALLAEHLAKIVRQPAATVMDGFAATVAAIKAQESMASRQRVEIKPSDYELA